MDEKSKREIVARFSEWYCKQDEAEPWLRVKDGIYQSMVGNLGENSLDLNEERDVFKLFSLALNWNSRKYGSFEDGINLFKMLNKIRFLDEIYDRKIPKGKVKNKVILSYFYLRDNWNEVYESLRGLERSTDVEKFIRQTYEKFKSSETTPLKVKVFFTLREMKSQKVLNIDDDYCCIPDGNVRRMMYVSGLSDRKSYPSTIKRMMNVSKDISRLFNTKEYQFYDMPLFWFYRTHCNYRTNYYCISECIIRDECLQRNPKEVR